VYCQIADSITFSPEVMHAYFAVQRAFRAGASYPYEKSMPLVKEEFRDQSPVALMLIDVINDINFGDADALLVQALPMARRLAALKREATALRIPTIYVNDNFGQWKSDFRHTVEHCCADSSRGREISRTLRPDASDYFVLKPKHSGFYATTLDLLLEYLKVDTLIITGIAANICVLFTANDAYMRDYRLFVPSDCVAANSDEDRDYSVRQMKAILKADIRQSSSIDLTALKERGASSRGDLPLGRIITAE
jgi:nicotinamidase-related amidase